MKFKNMITQESVESQPWQDELRPGDYVVNEQPVAGLIGIDLANGHEEVKGVFDNMPTIYCRIDSQAHAPGFVWVTAYSEFEPNGERGVQCIVDFTRKITQEEFEKAVKELGGTIKPPPEQDPSEKEARSLILQSFQELEQLKNEQQFFELQLEPEDAMALIATIQLALRHPDFDGPTAVTAREIVEMLADQVASYQKSALLELIERGYDPEYDTPQ